RLENSLVVIHDRDDRRTHFHGHEYTRHVTALRATRRRDAFERLIETNDGKVRGTGVRAAACISVKRPSCFLTAPDPSQRGAPGLSNPEPCGMNAYPYGRSALAVPVIETCDGA